jgi:hypothetical protein
VIDSEGKSSWRIASAVMLTPEHKLRQFRKVVSHDLMNETDLLACEVQAAIRPSAFSLLRVGELDDLVGAAFEEAGPAGVFEVSAGSVGAAGGVGDASFVWAAVAAKVGEHAADGGVGPAELLLDVVGDEVVVVVVFPVLAVTGLAFAGAGAPGWARLVDVVPRFWAFLAGGTSWSGWRLAGPTREAAVNPGRGHREEVMGEGCDRARGVSSAGQQAVVVHEGAGTRVAWREAWVG